MQLPAAGGVTTFVLGSLSLGLARWRRLGACGGHFPGSSALHWPGGPHAGGALFSGDALQMALDRRLVSFMYSYPNLVPM